MEQAVSADYLALWTGRYAQATTAEAQKQNSVVVFRLGAEWFAFPTRYCQSIENRTAIHSVPRFTNQAFLGVVNIRGSLQLCFSLQGLLQVAQAEENTAARIAIYSRHIVLVRDQHTFVIPVDEVAAIERIDDRDLESPPATLSQSQAEFVKGVVKSGTRRIALLQDQRVFDALEDAIGG